MRFAQSFCDPLPAVPIHRASRSCRASFDHDCCSGSLHGAAVCFTAGFCLARGIFLNSDWEDCVGIGLQPSFPNSVLRPAITNAPMPDQRNKADENALIGETSRSIAIHFAVFATGGAYVMEFVRNAGSLARLLDQCWRGHVPPNPAASGHHRRACVNLSGLAIPDVMIGTLAALIVGPPASGAFCTRRRADPIPSRRRHRPIADGLYSVPNGAPSAIVWMMGSRLWPAPRLFPARACYMTAAMGPGCSTPSYILPICHWPWRR